MQAIKKERKKNQIWKLQIFYVRFESTTKMCKNKSVIDLLDMACKGVKCLTFWEEFVNG